LQCPFKYFADRVLRLEEEREDEPGLTPQERGLILHEILQEFFAGWRASGRGSITVENLGEAVADFSRVAEARLAALGDADRTLERRGCSVRTRAAERAFSSKRQCAVVDRLLRRALDERHAAGRGRTALDRRSRGPIASTSERRHCASSTKLGGAPKTNRRFSCPVRRGEQLANLGGTDIPDPPAMALATPIVRAARLRWRSRRGARGGAVRGRDRESSGRFRCGPPIGNSAHPVRLSQDHVGDE
jgi:hypothetical protein